MLNSASFTVTGDHSAAKAAMPESSHQLVLKEQLPYPCHHRCVEIDDFKKNSEKQGRGLMSFEATGVPKR